MSVLIISASPSLHSRSAALGDWLHVQFETQGVPSTHVPVRHLDATALAHAQFQHPDVQWARQQVAQAQAVVVVTPLYKAAYSGLLKLWLDVLAQDAFKGKTVLPIATGGSPHHMLAIDYALRPVLQALGAQHILQGIYALESQVQLPQQASSDSGLSGSAHQVIQLHDDIAPRLHAAVLLICAEKITRPLAHQQLPAWRQPTARAADAVQPILATV